MFYQFLYIYFNKFTFLGGEQGLQFFQLASCGQDCQIKIWIISFIHILGMYSPSSSLNWFFVMQLKFLF